MTIDITKQGTIAQQALLDSQLRRSPAFASVQAVEKPLRILYLRIFSAAT